MSVGVPFHSDRAVEEYHCSTAAELLELLQQSREHWCEAGTLSPWVFRGQADASWGLVPKSLRPGAWAGLAALHARIEGTLSRVMKDATAIRRTDEGRRGNYETALRASLVERLAVEDFVSLADELGFPIPDRSPRHPHPKWGSAFYGEFATWDFTDDSPSPTAFALAQHHGVPTRLLDFTRQPRVAAFFAAQLAIENPGMSDRLAVWALRPHASMRVEHGVIRVLEVPRHQMTFLHAQHGLFIYDIECFQLYVTRGQWPDLAERVEQVYGRAVQPLLRKITLPAGEAEPLIRQLWTERVSRAHLMPSLDSITASLHGTWSWSGR